MKCSNAIKYFCMILLLCLALDEAETQEAISWQQCVKEARQNHPDLISAAAKIKQNKAAKEITRSAVLPQITGSASEDTFGVGSSGGGSGSSGTSTQGGSGGSSKRAKWSTTDYSFGATVQQLLFDGFKASYDLSTGERNIWASQYNYDVTSSNIRLRLRTAYANLLAAQELLRVTEEIKARRKQSADLVKLRYEGGIEHKGSLGISKADLAKASYEVNQARRSIYLAERQLTKELGRKRFMPMMAEGDLEVKEEKRERPDFEGLSETNPFLQQLIAQKEAARYGVKSAKAMLFPQIFAGWSESNSNTDDFPDENQWSLGTTLTLPIFDGGNTIATISKSKASLGQAEADERSGRDSVIYTLSNTWTLLQDALDIVEVQRILLEATKERAKIAQAEYAIGLLVYDNWIIIEDNLVSAKKSYLSAQRAALIAEANWIQAKGGTLEYDKN